MESYQAMMSRRQRGEKRPIPNEQKDEKYFERRKRNNEAAKKSRDARKIREDRVSLKSFVDSDGSQLIKFLSLDSLSSRCFRTGKCYSTSTGRFFT